MPENEEKKDVHKKPEVIEATDVKVVKSNPPWPLISIGIFATVVMLAFVIVGWTLVASTTHPRTAVGIGNDDLPGHYQPEGRMYHRGGGMFGDKGNDIFAMNITHGVVTAINGDTLTVSGNGKQVTVKKTSSTVIGGDKPAVSVNDTVIIIGDTESDESVTAMRIIIRNDSFMDESTDSRSDTMIEPGI